MAGLRNTICLHYLDDNLVHSSNFEEHIRLVLQRYHEHGVKLTPKKCNLFKRSVKFLGQLVTGGGYMMDPADGRKGKDTCSHLRGASNAWFSLLL